MSGCRRPVGTRLIFSRERGHAREVARILRSGHYLTNIRQARVYMLLHSGYRALWPVIFFLPSLFLGSAYLGEWVLHRRSRVIRLPSVRSSHGTTFSAAILLIIAAGSMLAIAPLALADPVLEADAACRVTTQEQARSLADTLFEQGAYQRAGKCYEAGGEYALANRAFMKAVEPQSALTARQLSAQRDQARTMLRKVQLAFRAEH